MPRGRHPRAQGAWLPRTANDGTLGRASLVQLLASLALPSGRGNESVLRSILGPWAQEDRGRDEVAHIDWAVLRFLRMGALHHVRRSAGRATSIGPGKAEAA